MTLNINQNNRYLARNAEGYLCAYDTKTHRCLEATISMGDNVDYILKHEQEWIGTLDPKYENKNSHND